MKLKEFTNQDLPALVIDEMADSDFRLRMILGRSELSGKPIAEVYNPGHGWQPSRVSDDYSWYRPFVPAVDMLPVGCVLPAKYAHLAQKPEPKYRPFKGPAEVPEGTLFARLKRRRSDTEYARFLVTYIGVDGVTVGRASQVPFTQLLQDYETAGIDLRWGPAGVLET